MQNCSHFYFINEKKKKTFYLIKQWIRLQNCDKLTLCQSTIHTMTSLIPFPMSSASALHLSPAFSIAMMDLTGTSVSLWYAKASARWRKPVRTAGQRNVSIAVYIKWIKFEKIKTWGTHHHCACVCESSDQQRIWAESLAVLPPQLGCLTRLTSQQWL